MYGSHLDALSILILDKEYDVHVVIERNLSLSVKPEDGEAVLFGKAVNELQSDVVVSDDEVTGTLKYVDGYVDFSSNVSEQSGNYLALKIEAEPAEAETVVELVGGTKAY